MDFLTQLVTDPVGFYGAHQLFLGQLAINCLLALSIGVTLRAGMFSQANAGFMAVGAYTAVLLELYHSTPFWLGAAAGVTLTALVSVPLYLAVARLSGVFLAIATIAFGELVATLILIVPFTGQGQGLIHTDVAFSLLPDYVALLAIALLLARLYRGRLGDAWTAIREDDVAAEAEGVPVLRYRLYAFIVGAAVAALAGALDVHLTFAVDPNSYRLTLVIRILVFAVAGGATTTVGPILGAAILTTLPEALRFSAGYRDALNGAILVLIVLLRPQGLVGRRMPGRGAPRHDDAAVPAPAVADTP